MNVTEERSLLVRHKMSDADNSGPPRDSALPPAGGGGDGDDAHQEEGEEERGGRRRPDRRRRPTSGQRQEDDDDVQEVPNDGGPTPSTSRGAGSTPRPKKPKYKFPKCPGKAIWNHFDQLPDEPKFAQCKYCDKKVRKFYNNQ